jgi:hypothetical protein
MSEVNVNEMARAVNSALASGNFEAWACACAVLELECSFKKIKPTIDLARPSHEWDRLNPHWVALLCTLERL